jgi:hypothetical protein
VLILPDGPAAWASDAPDAGLADATTHLVRIARCGMAERFSSIRESAEAFRRIQPAV